MTNDELIATVAPLLSNVGASFYFTPETTARGSALGLDWVQWYVGGRGGAMGSPNAATVHAAFGYFNPVLVERQWNAAAAVMSPADIGLAHYESAADHGRLQFATVDGLDRFNDAAAQVVAACPDDGLPLFAGYRSLPTVDDSAGLAMQHIVLLREMRGSAHLAAVRAAGLDPKTAHIAKRPDAVKLFGWDPADIPHIDDVVLAKMAEAETMTNAIVAPAFAVLDEDGRDALAHGVHGCADALR